MEVFDSDKYKRVILDVLVEVHDFCIKNNIRYYLWGGTLLGSVRHKGFIPWDDDIDIAMPRVDYEKFCSVYISDTSYIVSIDNTPDYYLPFAKVCSRHTRVRENITHAIDIGAYVDVFPLDKCLSEYEESVKFIQSLNLFRRTLTVKNMKFSNSRSVHKNVLLALLKTISVGISRKKLINIISNKSSQYLDCDDYRYLAEAVLNIYGTREIYKREWFEECVLLDFEEHQFFAPAAYDEVLKTTYGDYMTLPPVEQRQSTHSFLLL